VYFLCNVGDGDAELLLVMVDFPVPFAFERVPHGSKDHVCSV
jgi:hypothetical protein